MKSNALVLSGGCSARAARGKPRRSLLLALAATVGVLPGFGGAVFAQQAQGEGWLTLRAGVPVEGVLLSKEGVLSVGGVPMGPPLKIWTEDPQRSYPPPLAYLSPASPSGRFRFLQACEDEPKNGGICWLQYLVDVPRRKMLECHVGNYGAQHWVSWAEDERYAMFVYEDDENEVLISLDLSSAKSELVSPWVFHVLRPTFQWTGPARFKVAAVQAMEGDAIFDSPDEFRLVWIEGSSAGGEAKTLPMAGFPQGETLRSLLSAPVAIVASFADEALVTWLPARQKEAGGDRGFFAKGGVPVCEATQLESLARAAWVHEKLLTPAWAKELGEPTSETPPAPGERAEVVEAALQTSQAMQRYEVVQDALVRVWVGTAVCLGVPHMCPSSVSQAVSAIGWGTLRAALLSQGTVEKMFLGWARAAATEGAEDLRWCQKEVDRLRRLPSGERVEELNALYDRYFRGLDRAAYAEVLVEATAKHSSELYRKALESAGKATLDAILGMPASQATNVPEVVEAAAFVKGTKLLADTVATKLNMRRFQDAQRLAAAWRTTAERTTARYTQRWLQATREVGLCPAGEIELR